MISSLRIRLAIPVAALALVAVACGSDDGSDSTEAPAATSAVATTAATTAAPATTAAGSGDPYGEDPATTAPAATTGTSAGAGESVTIELGDTSLGQVLTSDGLTLYMFTPDEGGTPTCVDACAAAWPPLIADAGEAGAGITAADITVVDRPDGTTQLAYAGWPLYFYAEDQAPGDVIGQGVGDKWYVLGADGTPIETPAG